MILLDIAALVAAVLFGAACVAYVARLIAAERERFYREERQRYAENLRELSNARHTHDTAFAVYLAGVVLEAGSVEVDLEEHAEDAYQFANATVAAWESAQRRRSEAVTKSLIEHAKRAGLKPNDQGGAE